ncbi:ferric/cupric-chelate reductase [Phytophthora boehmeriae]|uniref:Ferric/cupric-chelate reductase n=1 Tax=Phytophthora boehmeriae TaxID=109152 RepID=A0A8T1VFW1_9STRA|nr:ferric/cupric-chelate reductase [Phytophthora boehmeriae]
MKTGAVSDLAEVVLTLHTGSFLNFVKSSQPPTFIVPFKSKKREMKSPHGDVGFASLVSPTSHAQDFNDGPITGRKLRFSPWVRKFAILGNLAQVLILASIFVYAYGQLFYHSATYTNNVSSTIGTWFGVPVGGGKDAGGHSEMVRPVFFFFFCFIPMAVSILLLEFLRHFNVRRISSRYVLNVARVLRRKPRVLGRVVDISLGELLFLAFLIGGNIYVFQYFYRARVVRMKQRSPELDFVMYLKIVGLTLGFTCVYNMAFLFLPATRNCVWMEFLNISYANGIKYHRWIGVVTVVTAFLHCLSYYWAWIKEGTWTKEALPCFNCAVGEEGHDPWMNFFGEIALLTFLAIGFTSIPWVRRKMYNTFYSVHHLFIIGTVFAVLHWNPIITWIFPSVMLYTICRAISSSNGFTPVSVREFTTLSHDVVKVVLSRSTTRAGDFKVGQFVYLNVPAISKLQWHAFTIGSSPRASPDTITILLKSLGDWTQELVKYSEDCKRTNVLPTVYLDGYYGASLEMYDEYSTVCLVGGGIGATPMFAILEDIVAKLQHGETLHQKVFFIFTFRELSLLEEIHPLLMQMKELDPQQQYFSLHFSLTRPPTDDQLDKRIDHDRLAGKSHVSATSYDTTITSKAPLPFAVPLRSSMIKLAMYTVAFFLTLLIWIIIRYGYKVEGNNANLWPLQNFVEIALLCAVAVATVFTFIGIENKKRTDGADTSGVLLPAGGGKPYSSDILTFRDLIAEYSVTIGARPDMAEVTKKVFNDHKQFTATHPTAAPNANLTIGVFVSGPKALKQATESAISSIGVSHFDVHEEEFDL